MAIRLPPLGFKLDSTLFENDECDVADMDLAQKLRHSHPELSTWPAGSIISAREAYDEATQLGSIAPSLRDESFIAYLYACQLMPFYRHVWFTPSAIDDAWSHFDNGTVAIHAAELWERVPSLRSYGETADAFLARFSLRVP